MKKKNFSISAEYGKLKYFEFWVTDATFILTDDQWLALADRISGRLKNPNPVPLPNPYDICSEMEVTS